MKQTPELQKAQANMEAGAITAEGFLGDDNRPVLEIITHDEEQFNKLGLVFEEVAEKLETLMKAGQKGLGEGILVENTWIVRTDEARGFLPSPFGNGIFRKVNVQVELKETGEKLVFSELNIHMLRDYHFLEGKGSAFRLEPERIKKVLKL